MLPACAARARQLISCLTYGIIGAVEEQSDAVQEAWYLGDKSLPTPVLSGLLKFGTCILIFTNFIPITLFVTLDIVKAFQALFMMYDLKMYHETTDDNGQTVPFPMKVSKHRGRGGSRTKRALA